MQNPDWLKDLLKWLKTILGINAADVPRIKILEEYHADGISVLKLEDPSIPGCIKLWRIDRHYDRIKFFLCIINLQQLREDLAARRVSLDSVTESRGGRMAELLKRQLQEQETVLATHLWITGWNREYSGVDSKGRHYRSHRTVDVRILACDLQGVAGPFAGDRHAKRFARTVIKQLSANEFREYHRHPTWQAAVKSIDWTDWLEGLSHTHIDPTHVLQPHKNKKRS